MDIRSRLANLKGEQAPSLPRPEGMRRELERALGRSRPASPPRPSGLPIERVVDGEVLLTPRGTVFRSQSSYNPTDAASMVPPMGFLEMSSATIAWLAGDPRLHEITSEETLFLDLETTGLGGAGSYPFLIGLSYYRGGRFWVEQLFMPGPSHEAAVLEHFLEITRSFRFLATFNGKTFDLNLLQDRFTLHRLRCPLLSAPHFDVLFPCRRIWRTSFDNCRLTTLERHVLGTHRGEDIDGALIPALYYHYVSTGRADGLAVVFRHNCQDLLSLAGLTGALLRVCENPLQGRMAIQGEFPLEAEPVLSPEQRVAVGLLHLRKGNTDRGMECLQSALAARRRSPLRFLAMRELSLAYKRQDNLDASAELWRQMVRDYPRDPFAYEELAKWCEHTVKDFPGALDWVHQAFQRVSLLPPAFKHRETRLLRLSGRSADIIPF